MDTPDEQADQLVALVDAALPDLGPGLSCRPATPTSSSPRDTTGSRTGSYSAHDVIRENGALSLISLRAPCRNACDL